MRWTRWTFGLIGVMTLVSFGLAAVFFVLASRAQPDYDGDLVLPGLSAPVSVVFGAHAIPSVRAANTYDLVFAQGFLTASERMWQMDLMRRVARGRLAEVFGSEALPVDRLMRTVGLATAAERNLAVIDPSTRQLLDAYAAGVNAYLDHSVARRPIEYLLIGIEPEPWSALDSMAIVQYMAYTLSFNAREELAFLRVAERVGAERARELFPADEGIAADPIAAALGELELGAIADPFAAADRLTGALGLPRPAPASNAWAVTGGRTLDGQPMLANDPHLLASTPNIWYEQELIAPGLHASGASIPGMPLVLIGHNTHLAWGLTTTMADTQDLVIEQPVDGGRAVHRARGSAPIRERWEVIPVRGAEPHRLRIRETDNGVLLNDVLIEERGLPQDFVRYDGKFLLALRWTIDEPDPVFEGIHRLNTAESVADARAAVGRIVHAAQNVLVAHRDGSIAWQISGRLPVRESGSGSFPVPGWLAGYGWRGLAPIEAHPYWHDPPSGQLVSANDRSVAHDFPVWIGRTWLAPYRGQRIDELLTDRAALTVADMADIQQDQVGIEARHYQARLAEIASALRTRDAVAWADAERLLAWDGRFRTDSVPAALFVLLRQALFHELLGDELGPALPAYMAVALVAYNGVQETVSSGRSSFWDDVTTPQSETAVDIWIRALRRARVMLDARTGPRGALGEVRQMHFPHAFAQQPLLGPLFSVGPLPEGGDDYTVNVRKAPATEPEKPVFIPGYRVLYTPGDWASSRSIQSLGQSGHLLSPYRSDQLDDWIAGRYHPLMWQGPAAGEEIGRLQLLPE